MIVIKIVAFNLVWHVANGRLELDANLRSLFIQKKGIDFLQKINIKCLGVALVVIPRRLIKLMHQTKLGSVACMFRYMRK